MFFGLNWVDLAILGVLMLFSLRALRSQFIFELIDLFSFILVAFISFAFYNYPAKFFESQFKIPHGLTLVLGFMAVWFLSETLFFFLIRLILPKIPGFKILGSKVLSVIPAILRGLIFIALILVMVATFPIQPAVKKNVLDSKIGSQILKIAYGLESPVKAVFGGLSNDSLTFLTIRPQTDERVNLGFQTNDFTADNISEGQMVDLVNKERMSRGIKVLVLDGNLRAVARSYSADMFKRGYFAHYSPEGKSVADRLLDANTDFLVVGENLAYAPSLELAFKGLMNSPGHKANILSEDYGKIGIGVMDGGIYGKMFTQIFTN